MIAQANSIRIPLADNSVHCCVTSPPYWALRSYLSDDDPLKPYELGLEPTPQEFVHNMVLVFREVWRVLRPDGNCWINLGDSYATAPNGRSAAATKAAGNDDRTFRDKPFNSAVGGLKPKDLCGIPWRCAFALQDDGWWLRSDIIWAKPNPMPESVEDRPTKSHEYLFLMTKQERYFYDAEAVRESSHTERGLSWEERKAKGAGKNNGVNWRKDVSIAYAGTLGDGTARNRRTVWTIATEAYPGAHFATFPTKLVEPCILAGTSARGCCGKCGAPWRRVVEKDIEGAGPDEYGNMGANGSKWLGEDKQSSGHRIQKNLNALRALGRDHDNPFPVKVTLGWRPSCSCNAGEPVPCIVLDPFCGSGTTGEVARNLGRRFVGLDLNPTYLAINALPRAEKGTSEAALKAISQEGQYTLFGEAA